MAEYSQIVKNNGVSNTIVKAQTGKKVVSSIRAWARGTTTPADIFIQLFDVADASEATLGATVPDWVVLILDGDNMTADDGIPPSGLVFENGVFIAATSEPTNGVVPAATVDVRLGIL